MKRFLLSSVFPVTVGIIIGWLANSYFGREGVQYQFNEAASRGDVRHMERLISYGADPLASPFFKGPNDYGFPAITFAASSCEPNAVKFLLSKGADPNFLSATETPLDLAFYKQKDVEEVIKILRENGGKTLAELYKKDKEQDSLKK